jgi:hypothetical protein
MAGPVLVNSLPSRWPQTNQLPKTQNTKCCQRKLVTQCCATYLAYRNGLSIASMDLALTIGYDWHVVPLCRSLLHELQSRIPFASPNLGWHCPGCLSFAATPSFGLPRTEQFALKISTLCTQQCFLKLAFVLLTSCALAYSSACQACLELCTPHTL